MTPEQRADAVWQKIIGVESEMAWFDYEDYLPFIVEALVAVRNEALEEALKEAETMKLEPINSDVVQETIAYNQACEDIATAIRDLKTTTG
jgi:aspartyl/asparaginyl-tRNA synthetase